MASQYEMNLEPAPERPSGFSMAPLLAASPGLPQHIKQALRSGRRDCAAALLVRDLGLSPDDACELVR
jgi:hypothetical protein